MIYENVKLWFAKDENGNIVTIDDVIEQNKTNTYSCPVCGSELKPKALKSKQITSHFAHVDASKCNSETMVHWWFKNKFIEKGNKFTVSSIETKEYICSEILIEQSYETEYGTYKPDVTIFTECGNTIYFEMAFTNKKQVKDYLDMWFELKNIVVEVDIKQLMLKDKIPTFKALFYEGKCFNTKRNDTYYNTIGKYKEEKLNGKVNEELKERILKLDWFWNDNIRYNNGEIEADELLSCIDLLEQEDRKIIISLLKKSICGKLYIEYKKQESEWAEVLRKKERCYYEDPLSKDSLIRVAIKKLNNTFRKIDKGYKVILDRESNKYKTHHWRYGRKIGYWKVSSYNYRICLEHDMSNWYAKTIYVTNLVNEMDNVEHIYNYLYEKMIEHEIKIECVECKDYFNITQKEVNFYMNKGFSLPKRCKSCRNKRKQNN